MFKRVVLFLRPEEPRHASCTWRTVAEILEHHGANIHIAEDQRAGQRQNNQAPEELQRCDLVIAVGGDGTLLHAARVLNQYASAPGSGNDTDVNAQQPPLNPPLLGINTGRLGFLTDIPKEHLGTTLEKVLAGAYSIEQRSILDCRALHGKTPICKQIAVNDVGVFKRKASLIDLETWIDGRLVLRERADGVIVSTPTGSTAYAMAGGGPILHPRLHALELVPICPLTLSHRPLVLPGDSQLSFRIAGHDQVLAALTCDGYVVTESLRPGDEVHVKAIPEALRLLHPDGYDYYRSLRDKLNWGAQPC